MSFYEWSINNCYNEKLSIDRINSYGNYEPDNCRWANINTQSANKRKRKNTTTNYIGISVTRSGSFEAGLIDNKKRIFRKTFKTIEEAVSARNEFIINNGLKHPLNIIS